MKLGNIKYTPVGYELGYCIGEDVDTKEKGIYYFKGYPEKKYKDCEIVLVKEADVNTFSSDTIMGEGRDKNHKFFKGQIVKKGIGRILSQDWLFNPEKGVQCDEVVINFGMTRAEIRKALNNEQEFNFSRGETEDSYEEFQNTSTWFRLGYNQKDFLQEIEFLSGKLTFKNITILGGSNVSDILQQFKSSGYKFYRKKYVDGLLCKELKMVIASSEDMGGEGEECEYFYTSSDITHLLEE